LIEQALPEWGQPVAQVTTDRPSLSGMVAEADVTDRAIADLLPSHQVDVVAAPPAPGT
jgi:hypothetical protein